MEGAESQDVTRTTIGVDVHPRAIRVRLQGDLDSRDAPRLDRVLRETIAGVADRPPSPVTRMTIDLEAVGHLTAAGMTVLLGARELAADRGLTCAICVNARGRRALALTGLDRVLLGWPGPS